MQSTDFIQLLRNTTEGNQSSWVQLLDNFNEHALTPEEEQQVHVYYKHAAKKNPHASFLQAQLYDKGFGVKQDPEMAFVLLRQAAGHAHGQAAYELGRRFLEGIGMAKEYGSAMLWLQVAASNPHYISDAMRLIGDMYKLGLGVAPDLVKAEEWYEKAKQSPAV